MSYGQCITAPCESGIVVDDAVFFAVRDDVERVSAERRFIVCGVFLVRVKVFAKQSAFLLLPGGRFVMKADGCHGYFQK